MKRVFAIVGVCLLASIVIASITTTKQELTLRATPKAGSGTAVEFNLPKASEVNLSIYDITGKKVTDLVQDRYLEAGEHSYLWDGKNAQGKQVGSGVYFVRLQAGKEYRGCKLTYIAKDVVISKSIVVEPEDKISKIKVEDNLRAEPEKGNLSKFELDKYWQATRKLAKAIAMALPKIQPELYKAMVSSRDEREHKVRLASFVNSTVSSQICATGYIENTELHRILKTYSGRLYIYIPNIVGGWTAAASKVEVVVAAPPHDEKDIDALGLKVYGYNTKGEELTFDPWIAPDYPTFSITPEAPFGNSASLLGTPDRSLKGGENAKAYPRIYWINVHCSKYDPWPWTGLEVYVVMCHYYYPSGGDATERTNLTDVDHPNKTYGVGEWIAVQRDIWDPYEEPVLDTAQYQQDSFDYLKVMEEDWGGGDDWIGTKNFVQPYWAPGGMTSPEYGGGGYYQCDGPGDDFVEVRLWTKVVEF